MRRLVRTRKNAALCTIHQPSREVFEFFDKVILLAKSERGIGTVAYFGPVLGVASYFTKLGYPLKSAKSNPADHISSLFCFFHSLYFEPLLIFSSLPFPSSPPLCLSLVQLCSIKRDPSMAIEDDEEEASIRKARTITASKLGVRIFYLLVFPLLPFLPSLLTSFPFPSLPFSLFLFASCVKKASFYFLFSHPISL